MEKSNLNTALQQAHAALKKYWYVPGLLILLAVLFLAGSWYGKTVAGQNAAGSRRILHYVDPMNPAHTSAEPGLAPCGMKMEPVYAEDGGQAAGSAMPPGSVKITPEKQQIIGVRVATVEKSPRTYTLRTVGKVAVDETRTYRLNAFSDGFITKVYDISTGSLVRKDEPLAMFYSKDLFTALQTYYYAVYALDNLQQHGQQLPASQKHLLEAQKRAAEYNLMNLGVNSQQIKDLIRSKEITQEIIINAPATSFVLTRNVTPGQKFVSGEELFRLADLSRVWIQADLFKNEARYVRPGEKVKVTLADQDESYMATVSEVLPEFDPATLTIKVRLEMDNPGFTLRPGMFVDVEFPINKPPTVNVPVDAIMDSGLKQTIFVERGNGYFEPRRVKTGWRLGDRVEIVEGLEPGERIVVSGNFLIDSESRMKLAAAGFFGNVVKDPVCGMDLDEGKARTAGLKIEHQGKSYYFCSDTCQRQFTKTPERYVTKPEESSAPERVESLPKAQVAPEKTQDPACGHEVDETQAKAAGLTSIYKGKTYYFCSYRCNKQFDKDPERYLHPEAQGGSGGSQAPVVAKTAQDPVCGLPVATGPAKQAGRTSEYQGKMYYFDTDGCKQRFDKDPQHYLSGSSGATLPQTYPQVPTNPDLLLRLRRDSIRAIPPGKGQALLEDPPQESQVKPAAPQTPPMQPPAQPTPPPQPQAPPPPHRPPGGGGHQHD
ncbi:MAG: efflux RND transporter periplasmic adaptor subunit [Proteobacteria bacterium]|nr:efflux RND transporter periplasmic adaptor subunit [Pseudomonadota bacterium]MCG2770835.1 efflux RND transporter periplasmic adaptor subunit [Desulfobacterales bacterium]